MQLTCHTGQELTKLRRIFSFLDGLWQGQEDVITTVMVSMNSPQSLQLMFLSYALRMVRGSFSGAVSQAMRSITSVRALPRDEPDVGSPLLAQRVTRTQDRVLRRHIISSVVPYHPLDLDIHIVIRHKADNRNSWVQTAELALIASTQNAVQKTKRAKTVSQETRIVTKITNRC